MAETTFTIGGMTCEGCVGAVTKSLAAIRGVSASQVKIGEATVTYDDALTDPVALRAAVTGAGFSAADS